jgi:hypothetical protein
MSPRCLGGGGWGVGALGHRSPPPRRRRVGCDVRTKYASHLASRAALHLDLFEQPAGERVFQQAAKGHVPPCRIRARTKGRGGRAAAPAHPAGPPQPGTSSGPPVDHLVWNDAGDGPGGPGGRTDEQPPRQRLLLRLRMRLTCCRSHKRPRPPHWERGWVRQQGGEMDGCPRAGHRRPRWDPVGRGEGRDPARRPPGPLAGC